MTTTARLDAIIAQHTALTSFADLMATSPSYVPTLDVRHAPELAEVADALVANGRDAYVKTVNGPYFAKAKFNEGFKAPELRAAPAPEADDVRNLRVLRKLVGDFSKVSCAASLRKAIEKAVSARRWDARAFGGQCGFVLTGPKGGECQITVRDLATATTKRTGKTVRIEG